MRNSFLTLLSVAVSLVFISMVFISIPSSAFAADGFICKSLDQDALVQVVLYPESETGTSRQAALMVIADLNVRQGRQTVVRFFAKDGMLSNSGTVFVGRVNPRLPGVRRGERIAGTVLGQLKSIRLAIDYSYGQPLRRDPLSAHVVYTKRDGEELVQDFACIMKLDR